MGGDDGKGVTFKPAPARRYELSSALFAREIHDGRSPDQVPRGTRERPSFNPHPSRTDGSTRTEMRESILHNEADGPGGRVRGSADQQPREARHMEGREGGDKGGRCLDRRTSALGASLFRRRRRSTRQPTRGMTTTTTIAVPSCFSTNDNIVIRRDVVTLCREGDYCPRWNAKSHRPTRP